MPLKVQKQDRESTQGLIRRFSQKMRKSGILLEARKKQFRRRGKSSQLKKRAALRREELRKRYEKLKKLGKL
ncbi:hypothetical protein CO121_00250 [bacterium (Candidatus Gribaldobacteria) CG_4_9_14_3_um_filter_36_15]|uniref:30S ribosomal protein S21 n=4 Tax=Candidatus Gribaldobacteria TaxID=2798536 RepID=A0A2M7VJU8_9BACT|nr:MAG: hypothetical protein AUK07_00710 [Parcubacteria group bacterium CG2_30_36_21]PIR91206.1 MAG: hypothetical protein COU02_00890 [bacterium (Candidatus Gribaldobacteria) CG10_big_fil_rev_8_21_14_0_10_37_46]PIV13975.1 MAG: hypothetical protein COS44_01480 [bacterium (Candidatus Gribaldobacteria) CG03_land_8_20_14_0_80_36_40]PJA02073.1 MAG: hypothetical protein COX73_02705 [bacterium (Candidatus Gribaldobacteria) CG_4_10_14_0_2_um_filter_36_18]PJB09386.1 MAG: hypothetical protein CO121_00250